MNIKFAFENVVFIFNEVSVSFHQKKISQFLDKRLVSSFGKVIFSSVLDGHGAVIQGESSTFT